MHKSLFAFAAAAMLADPALATSDLEMMQLANGLGSVLASETPCGLSFDPQAIQAFIAAKADPEDLSFTSNLSTMTRGNARTIEQMTPSALVAHCAAISRTASAYGFIPAPTH